MIHRRTYTNAFFASERKLTVECDVCGDLVVIEDEVVDAVREHLLAEIWKHVAACFVMFPDLRTVSEEDVARHIVLQNEKWSTHDFKEVCFDCTRGEAR